MNRIQWWIVLLLSAGQSALAVNGLVVSTACRYSSDTTVLPETIFMQQRAYENMGIIIQHIIRNSAAVSCDTIYSSTLAAYPTFSANGTKVAFLRFDTRVEKQKLIGDRRITRLSVMNPDGSDLRDIMVFDTARVEMYFDWPAGDWIYYLTNEGIKSKGTLIKKLWKVKYNAPSTNTLVYIYSGNVWKWNIALDATRAVSVEGVSSDGANIPHLFPPSQPPSSAGFLKECMEGCEGHICPGGGWYVHFYNASHNAFRIHSWKESECLSTLSISADSIKIWAGLQTPGRGMTGTRWAVNSDKWILVTIGEYRQVYKTGGNQVLVNWVDRTAISTTSNYVHLHPEETGNGIIRNYSCAGDFWINGGSANSYETVDGTWKSIDGQTIGTRNSYHPFLTVTSSRIQETPIFSIAGRKISSRTLKGTNQVIITRRNGKLSAGFHSTLSQR